MSIKKIFLIILSFVLIFCLCACGENTAKDIESEIKEDNAKAPKFSVKVTDDDGNAVEGVIFQLRKNSIFTARTNKQGIATFNLYVTDSYRLLVVQCPEGYEYNGENPIHVVPGSFNCSIMITKK